MNRKTDMIQSEFTPTFLAEQREKFLHEKDQSLIDTTKDIITRTNIEGKTRAIISYPVNSRWKTTVKHFEELGFFVDSYGNDVEKDYDENGEEVYRFLFNWFVKEDPL